VEVIDSGGRARSIPIADFHRLPGDAPQRDTTLASDELITSVLLPPPVSGKHIYRKVRDRASYAFALVSVAAVLKPDGTGRVAVGGVAHKPWRIEKAEGELPKGSKAFAAALLSDAKTTPDNAFKVALTERTVAAVIKEASVK
jgi:xanthine dehydrogenase YagS FAD-binding subunit